MIVCLKQKSFLNLERAKKKKKITANQKKNTRIDDEFYRSTWRQAVIENWNVEKMLNMLSGYDDAKMYEIIDECK